MPIQITAKRDGFRRCGMAHSDKTQTYADGHFSPAMLAELKAEPMLVVSHVPDAQQGNTEQSKELVQALAHIETLNGQLTDKDLLISELRKNNQSLLNDLSALTETNTSLTTQVDELTARVISLTPAPDTESKETESTKSTKTAK
ncbi:HI1506-related protein [Yersinia rohdei]|uniref:HI1506-related protein n=1 Tax=Yersinia rohdei TaxID=29485 RepID=UPI0011A11BEA|nr:HI1506-related protein [Yersinia rohdei]